MPNPMNRFKTIPLDKDGEMIEVHSSDPILDYVYDAGKFMAVVSELREEKIKGQAVMDFVMSARGHRKEKP